VTGDSQHGFAEGKSCLFGLGACCGGVAASLDKGRAAHLSGLMQGLQHGPPQHPSLNWTEVDWVGGLSGG